MTEKSTMPSAFKKPGAELIIVFLGVYGAFRVDSRIRQTLYLLPGQQPG
jgi:hypothetical protein